MKKEKITMPSMSLLGVATRTNNKNEMDPGISKIARIAGDYWGGQIADAFTHRSTPGLTYAAYTEFDSDEHGDYTFFMGEQVSAMEGQDLDTFTALDVPAGTYQKFTTKQGKMPDILIEAWQAIWQMNESDFGGKRTYIADFEVYDERASDPNNAVVDIYIGIEG